MDQILESLMAVIFRKTSSFNEQILRLTIPFLPCLKIYCLLTGNLGYQVLRWEPYAAKFSLAKREQWYGMESLWPEEQPHNKKSCGCGLCHFQGLHQCKMCVVQLAIILSKLLSSDWFFRKHICSKHPFMWIDTRLFSL